MTDELIKKIMKNYTIEIDGKRYIHERSIPSVIATVRNADKETLADRAYENKWLDN